MMKFNALLLSTFLVSPLAMAEEKKPAEPAKPPVPSSPAEPAKPAAPAPVPAGEEKVYAPTALEELKPLKGKKVTIEGPIVVQGENKSGAIRYLNFTTNYRQSVSLVFFATGADSPFKKEKLAEYVGKKVRVSGELTEFNSALQIKVTALDQLKVIE